MPLNLPNNPTVGQTSTQNGRVYRYAGGNVWELAVGVSGLTWSSVPASETAGGVPGQIAYDLTHLYLCVSSNRWSRMPFPLWDGSVIDNVITAESGDVLTTEAGEPILF